MCEGDAEHHRNACRQHRKIHLDQHGALVLQDSDPVFHDYATYLFTKYLLRTHLPSLYSYVLSRNATTYFVISRRNSNTSWPVHFRIRRLEVQHLVPKPGIDPLFSTSPQKIPGHVPLPVPFQNLFCAIVLRVGFSMNVLGKN